MTLPMPLAITALWRRRRRLIAKSWVLSRLYYPLHGARLSGRPSDQIWYFAYGANMHEATFRIRRGIQAFECRPGRIKGYRLRFNLEGRPEGKAAPANLCVDPGAEVWGVLYRIIQRDLIRLDSTEGVPGRGYRHVPVEAEDAAGRPLQAVAYIARGRTSTANHRCATSDCCARVREPTACPRITSVFWMTSTTPDRRRM